MYATLSQCVKNICDWNGYAGIKYCHHKYYIIISYDNKQQKIGQVQTLEEAKSLIIQYWTNHLSLVLPLDFLQSRFTYFRNILINDKGEIYTLRGQPLQPSINSSGYQKIVIKRKQIYVHRLVAELFVDNPLCLPVVNHKDGNKKHNEYSNLEWVSIKENTIHAHRMGLALSLRGEKHGGHKLSNEDILYIRSVYKPRDKVRGAKALAKIFNVSMSAIEGIVHYRTWKHLQ